MTKIEINDSAKENLKNIFIKLADIIVKKFKDYKKNNPNSNIIYKFTNQFGTNGVIDKHKVFDYLLNAEQVEIDRKIEYFKNLNGNYDMNTYNDLINLFKINTKSLTVNIEKKLKDGKYNNNIVNKWRDFYNPNSLEKKFTLDNKIKFINDKFPNYSSAVLASIELENFISYDYLTDKDRHTIISEIGVTVCPYCNRQYITNWLDNKGNKKATADLDHYYLKSLYPIASLCLYNFVPSCQICNSRHKLTADFYENKHIYPYERGFENNAKFTFQGLGYLINNDCKFELTISTDDENLRNRINNSLDTFKINKLYESHKDYVQELVQKAFIYNDSQTKEFLNLFDGVFESKEEIQRLVFGNYLSENDLGKRPLSKLTRDIIEELGVDL